MSIRMRDWEKQMSTDNDTMDSTQKTNWLKTSMKWITSNVFEKPDGSCIELFERFCNETECHMPPHSLRSCVFQSLRQRIKHLPRRIGMSNTVHLLFVLNIKVDEEFRKRVEEAGTVEYATHNEAISSFRANDGSIECKGGRVTRNGATGAQEYSMSTPSTTGRPVRSRKRVRDQEDSSEDESSDDPEDGSDRVPRRSTKRSRIRAPVAQEDVLELDQNGTPRRPAPQPRATGQSAEQARAPEAMEIVDAPNGVINLENPAARIERKPFPMIANIKTEHPPPVQNIKQEKHVNELLLDSYDILYYLRSLIDVLDHEALSDLRNKIIMEIDRPGREATQLLVSDFVGVVNGGLTLLKMKSSDRSDPLVSMRFEKFLNFFHIQLVNMQFQSNCELIQTIKEMAMTEKMISMSKIDAFLRTLYEAATPSP